MEPTASLQSLPLIWQYIGSTIVLIVTSSIAVYGWVKKNNPFDDEKPVATIEVTPDHGAIHKLTEATNRLADAQESNNRALDRLYGRLGDVYNEQERTNRLLKDLI